MTRATTRFTKGHGTRNDFVLLADTTGELDLTPELVRALADRRSGVGGDGVIRLVPTALVPESREVLAEDPHAIWFMDYRNADGSVAEMCGNGVRVFAAFAERLGLLDLRDEGASVAIGTRAGVKRVRKEPGGWYAVDMGPWHLPGGRPALDDGFDATVVVPGWEVPRPALSVDLGNPHTVLALAREDLLDAADLTSAPAVHPVPPHGTNVELVVPLGEETAPDGTVVGRVRMRVHERGVGETLSCGTGACAAALAVRVWGGPGSPDTWMVEVPGGTVRVRVLESGNVELAGPAELVFTGEVDLQTLLHPTASVLPVTSTSAAVARAAGDADVDTAAAVGADAVDAAEDGPSTGADVEQADGADVAAGVGDADNTDDTDRTDGAETPDDAADGVGSARGADAGADGTDAAEGRETGPDPEQGPAEGTARASDVEAAGGTAEERPSALTPGA